MPIAASPQIESIDAFVSRVVAACLDMRAIWRTDLCPQQPSAAAGCELLAFADASTLRRLRRLDDLHRSDVELLVVFDGDAFESAWGPGKASGSLSRWGWHQVSSFEAYYDRSCWTELGGRGGQVMRARRKAMLVWPSLCVTVHG